MEIIIRPLRKEDLKILIEIDKENTNKDREDYYKRKFDEIFGDGKIMCSLVAEIENNPVGFLIGQLFSGEYGIFDDCAYIDTLGVRPGYYKLGIGSKLIEQFINNMKGANVKKIYTIIDFSDLRLIKFFSSQGFLPSKRINLELEVL